MLCLIHSEISEAFEGFGSFAQDDKLPHRKMAEVELADVLIRIYDLAGAYQFNLDMSTAIVSDAIPPNLSEYSIAGVLCELHLYVSHAMEGYRKNVFNEEYQLRQFEVGLAKVVHSIWQLDIAKGGIFDLKGAIAEKLEYNAKRADHKLENRLKDDGKKF